jgi:alkyl hydroperoxide reductase subunit AhpC
MFSRVLSRGVSTLARRTGVLRCSVALKQSTFLTQPQRALFSTKGSDYSSASDSDGYSSYDSADDVYTNQIARIAQPAPYFHASTCESDGTFATRDLDEYEGKWLYLMFYPADFTFVCPTEITSISDSIDMFTERDCEVLGVSCDSKFVHNAWRNTPKNKGGIGEISFPLLSDMDLSISKMYGVLPPGCDDMGLPFRGSFLIDPSGVIRQITINDRPVGRSVDEAVRLLDALQYADSHDGEVCPMNWTPGESSMKADPQGSKDYFSTL